MDRLTILRPDDWHLHVRDGEALPAVVPFSARRFGRAILMPNLTPPIATVDQALLYRERVLAAVPEGVRFEPLMTLYLTEQTSTAEVERAAADPRVVAVKLYPAGATTNSEAGVHSLEPVSGVLEAMRSTVCRSLFTAKTPTLLPTFSIASTASSKGPWDLSCAACRPSRSCSSTLRRREPSSL